MNPADAEARHDRLATEPDPRDPSDAAEGPDPSDTTEDWQRCCNTPEQAAARLCGCKGEPYL